MGKATGFMEFQRETGGYRPVEERIKDYKEVNKRLPLDKISTQGARCMDCGIPFCHAIGCPLYNLIPEWNDAVYHGNMKYALERLMMTNSFPEITGRVCPAPCESSCTLSINESPVAIKEIELSIIEQAFKEGWIRPVPPEKESGKRVAVIGSGPAGLAAAGILRRAGHRVTVFEKDPGIGGILRYGIPDFKLDKSIIDRRLNILEEEGVRFETHVTVGEDISVNYLKHKFDIILLALGAGQPRDLHISSRSLSGIHFAMEYLTANNKYIAGQLDKDDIINAAGKNVLVLGGGDTGSDCVGTANRQGAKKIYQYEILDKPQDWKEGHNPNWPHWPSILRTSSSHEEGCEREWGVSVKKFNASDVQVCQAVMERITWGKDAKGRMKMISVPDSEFTIDVDLVFLAMGFVHVEHMPLVSKLDLKLDDRANIEIDSDYMTSDDKVYAAGDATTGASLVVRAIYHGQEAAKAINRRLAGL